MFIKIENNKVIVKQGSDTGDGFREATPLEESIINQGIMAQIDGAIYDPLENVDYQNELVAGDNERRKIDIQNKIDLLERIAGVRTFREYMISIGQVGAKTKEYPNGKTLDIDNAIKNLRSEIATF